MVRGAQRRRGRGAPRCGRRPRVTASAVLPALPQHRARTLGSGRSRAAGCLTGRRSASGAPQRPGPPSLPAGVARGPGLGRRGARRRHLKQLGYAGPAGWPSETRAQRWLSGVAGIATTPIGPRGAERRQKKGREPGSAERAPRSALSAARAPSPAPHAPVRAPRPPAPLSTPAPHTGAQPAGQTTGTPTPTAPPPRGASC